MKNEIVLEGQGVDNNRLVQKIIARLESLKHSGEYVILIYWLEKTSEYEDFELYDSMELPLTWITKIAQTWGKDEK